MPFSPTRSVTHILLLAPLLLIPPLYLRQNPTYFKARLHLAESRRPNLPSAQTVIVSGFSLPRPTTYQYPDKNSTVNPNSDTTNTNTASTYRKAHVAVCITGHLRSFARASVRSSIRTNLLNPLHATVSDVHLFFHVGRDDIARKGIGPSIRRRAKLAETAIRSEFAPQHLSFFTNKPSPVRMRKCPLALKSRAKIVPPALHRAAECLHIIRQWELARGRRYDWVYKTRPDIAFGAPVSMPHQLRRDTLYVNMHLPGTSTHAHPWLRRAYAVNASVLNAPVGDHVLVAARDVAEIAFTAERAFHGCGLYTMPKGTVNSEVGLTYWLVRNRVRYRAMPWFWMLVRDETGPECFRVKWIRDGTTEGEDERMRRCLEYAETDQIP